MQNSIKAPVALVLGSLLCLAPAAVPADHVHVGVGIGIGGGYYYPGPYYGPYYYPGPYYAYPPPVYYYAPPPPTTVVEQQPGPAAQQSWYYCDQAKAYYPYVTACPGGWRAVPASPPPQAAAAAPAQALVTISLGDVLFASGRAELQPQADSTMNGVLDELRKYAGRRILIEGHTDDTGDDAANLALSRRRAEAVRDYLVGHGIAADSITAVGKGKEGPVAGNATEEGRQRNRRVDIIVTAG